MSSATSTLPGSKSGSAGAAAGSAWSAGPTVSPPAAGTRLRRPDASGASSSPPPDDWDEARAIIKATATGAGHPIWHLSSDESQNRAVLQDPAQFPGEQSARPGQAGAEVLARNTVRRRRAIPPAVVVQPYGRGRTMAMTTAITRRWASEFTQSWGGSDARYYKKFWRNVDLLADRKLFDRPPPPAGRDRQAALSAGRADRRSAPGPSTRTPRPRSTTASP